MVSLREIWGSKWLTNAGPFHEQFEMALADYLGVEHLSLFSNGTLALITALQALRVKGEVITTPYSFVATTHALRWNGLKPVFVDIEPGHLTLDPARIEAAITDETTALLPVHVYGNPCDTAGIQKIADAYDLKVIYDAAHAFGTKRAGRTILECGDLSILSFHATKVFNTFEGGAIISPDARTKQHIDHLKNFGFVNETTVVATGINGKMSELNAALGLLQLKHVGKAIARRKEIDALYRSLLGDVQGIRLLEPAADTDVNCSYFPILVEPDYPLARDVLYQQMKDAGINGRRYFYPLISDFPMYRGLPSASANLLPVAKATSSQVICLPIYPALSDDEVARVSELIRNPQLPVATPAPMTASTQAHHAGTAA